MNSTRWASVIAGLAVGAAACGAGGAATATSAHVDSNNINAAAAVSAASGSVVVKTRHVSPYGTVLTTSTGRTLYIFTADHKGSSSCTGACATTWPPLLVPKGGKVSGISGLGTIKRSDGTRQVTHDGYALYRYSGDSAAGQVNGQGVDGDWLVATPSGASKTPKPSPSPTKSSPPSGGGYGY